MPYARPTTGRSPQAWSPCQRPASRRTWPPAARPAGRWSAGSSPFLAHCLKQHLDTYNSPTTARDLSLHLGNMSSVYTELQREWYSQSYKNTHIASHLYRQAGVLLEGGLVRRAHVLPSAYPLESSQHTQTLFIGKLQFIPSYHHVEIYLTFPCVKSVDI